MSRYNWYPWPNPKLTKAAAAIKSVLARDLVCDEPAKQGEGQ